MIFLDLDNTLVCVREQDQAPVDRRWIAFSVGQTAYRGVARPGVHAFLGAVRDLAPTSVMTFSRSSYAQMVCYRFDLGFLPAEVVAQDAWHGGWLAASRQRTSTPAPTEVLVANESDITTRSKLEWLGAHARLVVVPDYNGDGDMFDWSPCLAAVRAALQS